MASQFYPSDLIDKMVVDFAMLEESGSFLVLLSSNPAKCGNEEE